MVFTNEARDFGNFKYLLLTVVKGCVDAYYTFQLRSPGSCDVDEFAGRHAVRGWANVTTRRVPSASACQTQTDRTAEYLTT